MTEPMKTGNDTTIDSILEKLDATDDGYIHWSKISGVMQEYAAQQVSAERERIKTELKEKLNGSFKMSLQRAARIQQYLPKNEILELIDSL